MGRPHIVRYHWYKNQKPPLKTFSEERNTMPVCESSRAFEVRRVGYVITYDVSGSSYCEERECSLYEIRNTVCLKHEDERRKAVRASRLTVTYGFVAEYISSRILPEHHEYFCIKCCEDPNSNIRCDSCNEYKKPFVLITDCFSRPQILDALSPKIFHVDARSGTRPYLEDLFAAALHPERKNLWDSVLDYEDALHLKNNLAE